MLFGLLSLPCVSKAASAAPKIPRKLLAQRCEAVFTELIFGEARKRPQGILAVFPRDFLQHRRKSARENRFELGVPKPDRIFTDPLGGGLDRLVALVLGCKPA